MTKSQSIASLDATSIVESAARLIRSRATASAVVTRLGLDKDPTFTRLPILVRLMSEARSVLHQEQIPISQHDLAIRSLQSRLNVTNEPRSYLITIAATAGRAEQAAQLANTVASEYLRNEALQRGADLVATAEREFGELSSTYGARHPKYLEGQARTERLRSDLARVRDIAKTEEIASLVVGQSFIPARPVLTPSSPNVMINLALAAAGALVLGGWLALLLERRRRARSVPTEVVSDGEDGVRLEAIMLTNSSARQLGRDRCCPVESVGVAVAIPAVTMIQVPMAVAAALAETDRGCVSAISR